MAILRKNNKERFTTVPQSILRDKNLSLKEMGLLIKMLSLPDDWEFSEKGLFTLFDNDGKTSIKNGLKRLEELGYLERKKAKGSDGRFYGWDWFLSEEPNSFNRGRENRKSENPMSVKQTQYNTNNIPNTNISNTNSLIYSRVVGYLNEKANTNYKSNTKKTQQLINARLSEGYSVEDFITVIDKKCAEWVGTQFEQYLKPDTLFSTKFEGYLNQNIRKEKNGQTRKFGTSTQRQTGVFDPSYADAITEELPSWYTDAD